MRRRLLILAAVLPVSGMAGAAMAGSLAALRTLPAGSMISAGDITFDPALNGGLADTAQVIGKEARVTVYEGRPILASSVIAPTLVDRNQSVSVGYSRGGLSISTEGRALGRGGAGDVIRVLNIASRVTVSARINPDGTLSVVSP